MIREVGPRRETKLNVPVFYLLDATIPLTSGELRE